ncbi:hypothetical protein [Clostridium sp. C8]|jgi:hypothetical protein|uniref:Uncharacterized protein n=1 Tax=bioreactor metagenome TaxID=1076179 RepID=A0A644VNM0_9ZZZZ|nr:hypothetical protein [Clostridium sp. C8]KLE15218.1 hypothetical protein AAT22_11910 [Clostridium sp. C8]
MKKIYILLILNIITLISTKKITYIYLVNILYIPFLYDEFLNKINRNLLLEVNQFKEIIISYLKKFSFSPIELEIVFENSLGFSIIKIIIKNLLNNNIQNYGYAIIFTAIALFLIFWANMNIKKLFIV